MKTATVYKAATSSATAALMAVKRIATHGITHPFGDSRSVQQAFPAGIGTKDSDPFLMCDYFDAVEQTGKATHDDDFPVDWHPHRGMDIATYLRSGTGRHADSLGNRETFETPGLQWMSVGSGVVHAEGGGTEKGVHVQGFQIWINVPAERKMDSPRYGTVPSQDLPNVCLLDDDQDLGVKARVLAGEAFSVKGPFETVQPVQMIDFELDSGKEVTFDIQKDMDTAMLYVYEGALSSVNGDKEAKAAAGSIILLDATSNKHRGVHFQSSSSLTDGGAKVMLFAGKKLGEPVAWHGPIVMNTQAQIRDTLNEIRSNQFPPKRVPWDYKRLSSKKE